MLLLHKTPWTLSLLHKCFPDPYIKSYIWILGNFSYCMSWCCPFCQMAMPWKLFLVLLHLSPCCFCILHKELHVPKCKVPYMFLGQISIRIDVAIFILCFDKCKNESGGILPPVSPVLFLLCTLATCFTLCFFSICSCQIFSSCHVVT